MQRTVDSNRSFTAVFQGDVMNLQPHPHLHRYVEHITEVTVWQYSSHKKVLNSLKNGNSTAVVENRECKPLHTTFEGMYRF